MSPSINASDELIFKVKLKNEDWDIKLKEFVWLAYNEWKWVDFEVIWFAEQTDEDMMRKLRGNLWALMSEYCQEKKINLQEETERLRGKYKVKSRTEMTRFQLDEAIESYRAGLNY